MWISIKHIISVYYTGNARYHFRHGHLQQCLKNLVLAERWDNSCLKKPKVSAYYAICHLKLKQWDNISSEVESSLFLLRRFINSDKESFLLWLELKSYLANLRDIQPSHKRVAKARSN